ncbi:class I SAM-dependent methyltransferase [Streptomyces roseoverticillatus]|uniref:Class I SAM-dependent methyltransferase n=1 Tax=Streptomyces roseoverticillatus TaxID=66429 RepID=A0ABV3J262_9ACTN
MSDTSTEVTRERLLEMMTAFKETYLLRTAIELKVFDSLAEGPADAAHVARAVSGDPRATRILLHALAAAGLLDTEGTRFRLPPGAAQLLVTSSPAYFGGNAHIASSTWEWDTMRGLPDVVRNGGPLAEADAESPGFPFWVDFATHLTGLTRAGAALVADALGPWAGSREELRILDVGCGHGLFGLTLAGRHPHGRVRCQDWPNVLEATAGHARRMGLEDRTSYLPGDAFEVPLDGPYDVIVLANFLLQFSYERSLGLLRRLAPALAPGGRIVITGFTTGEQHPTREYHAHMLALLMLATTSGGEPHSSEAYRSMLTEAGLRNVRTHAPDGLPLRVTEGERA